MTQLLTKSHHILVGDVIAQLKGMPPKSVHCIVTSPPYFGLRDYSTAMWEGGDPLCNHRPLRAKGESTSGLEGSTESQNHAQEGFKGNTCPKCGATKVDHQLGLEKTPALYIKRLVKIMREARRVLRDDGCLWLNLGDSYWGSWGNSGNRPQLDGETRGQRERQSDYLPRGGYDNHRERPAASFKVPGLKNKDLIGIPWMAAFALRADGWWLRSDVIWSKPNPMPESVMDRPAKSHEYLFLLTKSADYFYDAEAVRERAENPDRVRNDKIGGNKYEGLYNSPTGVFTGSTTRNKRTVWTISTLPSQVSHFAVFPPALPLNCILASTSAKGVCSRCGRPWRRLIEDTGVEVTGANGSKFHEGKTLGHQPRHPNATNATRTVKRTAGWAPDCACVDHAPTCHLGKVAYHPSGCDCPHHVELVPATVLDPFHGSGTTGAVAEYLGRRYIGVELNPEYTELYDARCAEVRRAIIGGDSPDGEQVPESQINLFEEPK